MKQQFISLYDEYYPKIYSYTLVRVRQKQLAEDVTQQAFLHALRHIDSFVPKKGAHFGSWLFKIASNIITDHFRKNKEIQNDPILREMLDEITPEKVLHQHHQDEQKRKEWERIMKAIDALNEEERMIITLKYLSGFSYKEIAEIANKKPNTLAVILKRALQKIRKDISYDENEKEN